MKTRLAFSNGSEFDIWRDSWCNRCTHDEAFLKHNGDDGETGCEIVAVALMGAAEEIPEWSKDPTVDGWPNVICSAFQLSAPKEP